MEEYTEKSELQVLLLLHRRNPIWCEELVGHLFERIFTYVLTTQERQYVELHVQGYEADDVIKLLKITNRKRYLDIRSIVQRKYKQGIQPRVDNLNPDFIKRWRYAKKVNHRKTS